MASMESSWAQLTRVFDNGSISAQNMIEIKIPKFSIGRSTGKLGVSTLRTVGLD